MAHGRARTLSTITAMLPPEQRLAAFHPALSMTHLLDVFGPLAFCLHRQGLLREAHSVSRCSAGAGRVRVRCAAAASSALLTPQCTMSPC